jgi:hypothetical protein
MVENIQIRNPAVRELVAEQQAAGVGRSAAETAENLIRAGAEHLREKRQAPAHPTNLRAARSRKPSLT